MPADPNKQCGLTFVSNKQWKHIIKCCWLFRIFSRVPRLRLYNLRVWNERWFSLSTYKPNTVDEDFHFCRNRLCNHTLGIISICLFFCLFRWSNDKWAVVLNIQIMIARDETRPLNKKNKTHVSETFMENGDSKTLWKIGFTNDNNNKLILVNGKHLHEIYVSDFKTHLHVSMVIGNWTYYE